MTAIAIQSLIITYLGYFTASVLVILTAVIGVGVAYLIFRFGWKRVITDQSLMISDIYIRKLPFRGYNRFRSKEWNMKNM